MSITSGIYKIVNEVNGKYYVGSSKNIVSRYKSHMYQLRRNIHKNVDLQYDYNNGHKFECIVIESVTLNDTDRLLMMYENMNKLRRVEYYIKNDMILPALLLIVEQLYLNIAKQHPDTNYQQCYQADGGELSMETKNKISIKLKGRTFSDEHKRRIGESNRNRVYSELTRRKIGLASSNRVHSQYTKDKIAEKVKQINHDKNIYRFTRVKTGEVFIGTRNDFRNKYAYSHDGVRNIIRGKYKTYPVWTVDIVK
jgi:hypothetical protein